MHQTYSKPDILILCAGSGIGGMERIVMNLANHLRAQHLNVRVMLPDPAEEPEAARTQQWFSDEGLSAETHVALQHSSRHRTCGHLFALWRLIRLTGAPVINIHYCTSYIRLNDVLAVRLAGRRCVVSLHAISQPRALPDSRQNWRTCLASHLCASVVVVSRFQRQELIQAGVAPERIDVIPCGIKKVKQSISRTEARASLGLPADSFVIVTACRLVVSKGTAELIKAVSHLPDPDGKLRLVIAGEGSECNDLLRQADSLLAGRCLFLGFVADLGPVYQAADVFALASHDESFGLVYAEAALHGVPSVGTLVGGIPETVRDGETGLLVEPHDSCALAAALQTLWDAPELRVRLGCTARQRALTEFTEEVMVERYQHVLKPCLKE